MFLHDKFPRLYNKLIPDTLDLEVPDEAFADCNNCHLASTEKKSMSLTKCCTYHATLPNYIVGAILSEDDKAWAIGKSRINNKIAERVGVTPYGIVAPFEFKALLEQQRDQNSMTIMPFDVREQLTCPYLDNGKCSIWKYRSELCITYFCNSVGGKHGKNFWNALYQYVREVEKKLSLYALKRMGYGSSNIYTDRLEPDSFTFKNSDGSFDENNYRKLWGPMISKETSIYIKAYQIINQLSPDDVNTIIGWEVNWLKEQVKTALDIFKGNLLPEFAIFNTDVKAEQINEATYEVVSPKGNSISLTKRQYFALKEFDGTKNLQDILRHHHGMLPINSEEYSLFLNLQILNPI